MTHPRTFFAPAVRSATLIGLVLCCSTRSAQAAVIVGHQQLSFMQLFNESPLAQTATTFGDPGLFVPSSIAIGPDNDIYVAANFSQSVFRFDGETFAPLGAYAFFPGSSPGTIHFSPSGELYMADASNGNIHKFQGPSGGSPGAYIGEALAAPINSNFAMSFAFDPNSTDIIVAKDTKVLPDLSVSFPALYRVNSSGVATQIGSDGVGGLTSASSLLFGPNGELYVVDIFGNQILKFTDLNPAAPVSAPFITFSDPSPVATGSNYPSDILLDSNGNLLVSLLGQYNLGDPGGNPPEGALRIFSIVNGSELPGAITGLDPISAIALLPEPALSNPAAPEPSAGLLACLGVAGMGLFRRRQRKVSL